MTATVVCLALIASAGMSCSPDAHLEWPSGAPLLVASYSVEGGYGPYSWELLRPPELSVYSNGLAVADATWALMLPVDEVSELVRAQRRGLADAGDTVTSRKADRIADAAWTRLTVHTHDRSGRSVTVYALGDAADYREEIVAAKRRMESLANRVRARGTRYTSNRVRVVLDPVHRPETWQGAVSAWPPAVAWQTLRVELGVYTADLDGAAAVAIERISPPMVSAKQMRPAVQAPHGELFTWAWRYLLPSE